MPSRALSIPMVPDCFGVGNFDFILIEIIRLNCYECRDIFDLILIAKIILIDWGSYEL